MSVSTYSVVFVDLRSMSDPLLDKTSESGPLNLRTTCIITYFPTSRPT